MSVFQVFSVFTAVPPVILTAKFVYSRRWNLFLFFRRLPWLCAVEVVYLVTGIKLAPHAQDDHLPFTHPASPSPKFTLQEVFVTFPNVSLLLY